MQTLLVDHLDGSVAEGTVRFGLDGAEYEIDLNAEHAAALRNALAAYVGVARWVGSARKPARSGRRESADDPNPTEVREWAKVNGIDVKTVVGFLRTTYQVQGNHQPLGLVSIWHCRWLAVQQ